MKGNVVDLAVGVIIGVAFGTVVTSLVNDVIMPPIGLMLGGLDFKDFFVALDGRTYASLEQAKAAAAPVIAYGIFINTLVNFLIVAFAVFLVVKQVNRIQRPSPVVAPATKECRFLRDECSGLGDSMPGMHVGSQDRCLIWINL